MVSERIVQALRAELDAAIERCDAASAYFEEVVRLVPGGISRPDRLERTWHASREYTRARQQVLAATGRLNEYLLHGTVPLELEIDRKPAGTETSRLPDEKMG